MIRHERLTPTLPAPPLSSGLVTLDRLHVAVHGPAVGPTVVLVHGAPDRSGSFRTLLEHLADSRVVVYDRRGYGRSVKADPPTSMLDHAHDLLEIVERFEPPRVVVAHSFGSNPTMLAATLRPAAFDALGLWEPPLPWLDWWSQSTRDYNTAIAASDEPGQMIEDMYRRLLGDEAWEALPPEAQERRRSEGVAFQVDMGSELTAPFAFADVRVPALVGYGTKTSQEHIHGARWLAGQLPGGRAYVVKGAGHFAHQTHPEQFASFVRRASSLVPGGV